MSATAPEDREVRIAPSQAEFDALVIPSAPVPHLLPRMRLAGKSYVSQFFANPRSRLTPISRNLPCVYLGESKMTAIAEVYADDFWACRKKGIPIFVITKAEATERVFMEVPVLPTLKLCDLTNPDVRLITGLDSGTIYTTDLSIPQTWAERIANHPANFDGILYRSRPTDQLCMVLWNRPGGRSLDHEITFPIIGDLANTTDIYRVAQLCQIRLAIA